MNLNLGIFDFLKVFGKKGVERVKVPSTRNCMFCKFAAYGDGFYICWNKEFFKEFPTATARFISDYKKDCVLFEKKNLNLE